MNAKKETVLLEQDQPRAQTKEPTGILSQSRRLVNATNALRELRLKKEIPANDMVAAVRRYYPRYDKHLQSKCEHSSLYGIRLCDDAMDALIRRYAPEELALEAAQRAALEASLSPIMHYSSEESVKEKKPEYRNLPCRISCRMTVMDYNVLMDRIAFEGFQTTQDWLLSHLRKYLNVKGEYHS